MGGGRVAAGIGRVAAGQRLAAQVLGVERRVRHVRHGHLRRRRRRQVSQLLVLGSDWFSDIYGSVLPICSVLTNTRYN